MQQRNGFVVECKEVITLCLQHGIKTNKGFIILALLQQHVTQLVLHLHIIGVIRDEIPVDFDCLIVPVTFT
jgi:hypothetical protein